MKMYVDSEIESCLHCPCHHGEHGHCQITGKSVCEYVPKACPLQSLADYTKQVRKEVCEEIRKKCERTYTISPSTSNPKKEILIIPSEILEQLQGENNANTNQ